MENKLRLAFFPYLKTSEAFNYRGLILRNNGDQETLSDEVANHLRIINNFFYLRDGQKIERMVYTFWEGGGREEQDTINSQKLFELSTVLAYLYSSPHKTFGDPFLTQEHANIYIFFPKQITKFVIYNDHNLEIPFEQQAILNDEKLSDIEGYEVILNNRTTFWITEGFRIYPPTPSFWLNISQDVYSDLAWDRRGASNIPIFKHFHHKTERNDLDKRILTSLTWYNRSISNAVPEELAIVFLAVAFESILGLQNREKLTERFKESINLLLGNIPRLDSWLTQFYNARSQILHEGQSSSLMFSAIDTPNNKNKNPNSEYRSLVSYGRHIFRICVSTLLTGSTLAEELGIPSMLITNQERYEKICNILDHVGLSPLEKIIAVRQYVRDINDYQFVEERELKIGTLLGAMRRIISIFLETQPQASSELLSKMNKFVKTGDGDKHYEALSLLSDIRDHLPEIKSSQSSEASIVVSTLLESVWHYLFMYYYELQRNHSQGKEI